MLSELPSDWLLGQRILVVEDDYMQAKMLSEFLTHCGAEVLGPVGSAERGMRLACEAAPLSAALLDVKLADGQCYPLADELRSTGIPIMFTTGYDQDVLPSRFADTPHCLKPIRLHVLAHVLRTTLPLPRH